MDNKLFSVGCIQCGAVHSYYGTEAELLWDIVNIYGKRSAHRDERYTAGVLVLLENEATCCDKPQFMHGWRNYK